MKKVVNINKYKKSKSKVNKNETEREKTKRIFEKLATKKIIFD